MRPDAIIVMQAARRKLAAATPARDPDAERLRSQQLHVGAGVGGAAALHHSRPLVTGRERLYHGTYNDAAKTIRAQGLRPRSEVGGHGITDILPDEVREQGKKLVYMTPSKMEARSYAVQAKSIQRAGGDAVMGQMALQRDPVAAQAIMDPFNNKGIVKADVPMWKLRQQGKVVPNPELMGLSRKAWAKHIIARSPEHAKALEEMPPFVRGVAELAAGSSYGSLRNARVIDGGVGPEFIRGSGKFKRLGMQELKEYVAAHPRRFGGGLALGAAGLAGLGYAASGLRPRKKEAAMSEDLLCGSEARGLAVARLLLKVASARGIARPLGKALRLGVTTGGKVVRAAGDAGAGIAEGLGASESGQSVGKLLGQGVAVGAGVGTARKGKRKVDEWRYRNGLYSGM